MKLFDRFKKTIACAILTAFIPSQAWAQGITIPAGSALNLNDSTLTAPENITNAGTLGLTTGTINIIGNWTNSGTLNAGTSTVNFKAASGTQTLNSGGAASADAFYDLTHNAAGTVQLNSNAVLVNENFTNSSGTFNANSLNMTVDNNWDNAATFTPGTGTVTLGGTNQTVLGSTSFYNFSKVVSSGGPYTLFFDSSGTQDFTGSLTMQGNASDNLDIRSTTGGTYADIALTPGRPQSINDVDVQDSDAGTSPAQETLVGRGNSNNSGHNMNWTFGNTTITWTGVNSTEWNDPLNWSPSLVPAPGDTVIVPPVGGSITYDPNLCPTVHTYACGSVTIGNLTIQSSSSLTLNGQNLTVSTAFSNTGNFILDGTETVSLTQDITDAGTFTYVGDNTGHQLTITDFGATDYYNLVIDDTNAAKDTFITNSAINTVGNVSVKSGTMDISMNADTLTTGGKLRITGGTLTATMGNIIVGTDVFIGSGTLTAPGTGKTFTVGGNFVNNAGVGAFNNSSGLVQLTGSNQTVKGSTTFYQFSKTIPPGSAYTLTFDATSGAVQTFANKLTLLGNSSYDLNIASTAPGTAADIILSPGATQDLSYLSVQDSNAGTSPADVTLVPNNSTGVSNNTNWIFGGVALTWKGTASTDWGNTPGAASTNWNLGFVPRTQDSVIIPGGTANEPALLTAGVTVTSLTIGSGASASTASLTLNGNSLTVSSSFTNNGNLILEGVETLGLTQDTSDHGTFTYVGDGSGNPITIKDYGANDYYNLAIDDIHSGGSSPNLVDTYTISANALHVLGDLTVTASSLNMSGGTVEVDGSVTIAAAGTLIAPSTSTNTSFTVGGSWTNSGGTFTDSGGKVSFVGTNQGIVGNNTFAYLRKVVTSADTFTLDHNGTQTITTDLTMTGMASPNQLALVSNSPSHQAALLLLAGGTQTISDLSVMDSNAGATPADVTLVDRNNYTNVSDNTNWQFGAATLTWKGGTSTNWNTPSNWDLGVVPIAGDNVIIANAANQPVLTSTVSVGNLTINNGSSLTLGGYNLTVSTTFLNNGNVTLEGNESLTLTMDSTHGTFTYVGLGGASSATHTLTINGSTNVAYNNLVIDDPNATPADRDVFATNGSLTINGNLSVTSGTLNTNNANSSIALTGSVTIASNGIFDAPPSGKSFTVAGSWTDNNGTFNADSGAVTFTGASTAIITGNTTFYDLVSLVPDKTIEFTATSDQTVTHTFNFTGGVGNLLSLVSTSSGSPWSITFPNGAQTVGELNVKDSDAVTNTVTCLNCTNSGNNNTNWIFASLNISAPASGTTVGQAPTLIGTAPAGDTVYIRDISNDLVATAKADTNGNFRVVVGHDAAATGLTITAQLATGANSLTPYLTTALISPGDVNTLTVSATTTTNQVPTIVALNGITIVNPTATQFISGATPTVTGQGLAGQPVTVQARDANGKLLLAAGSGTVTGSGNYSVTLTTALPSATNYLSVTVGSSANETTSALIEVALTDPFGYVYNSSTNQVIQGATVTLYDATTKQIASGTVQSCNAAGVCCNMTGTCVGPSGTTTGNPPGNPFTTLSDGFYSFLASPGQYYLNVSAAGYNYPSIVVNVPSGRTVGIGSKGQTFTVGSTIFELDQPVDGNSTLLHITKTANKSEASVGDIVMYTVNIQNLSSTDPVNAVYLNDEIPPGFKYIKDRVLMGGQPTGEPSGQRPLIFNIGTVPAATTLVLQYQLVIGSGVTMGNYQNTATARFATGTVISNPAQASVRIIPDPVFDLGTVIGKVFFDWNENGIQDAPYYDPISHETIVEKPVPNVQIMMEDGTVITTDRNGQYDIPGLLPGRHIFRLDERTLPPGAYLTTDKAVIADITAGSITKVNFGVNIDESQTKGRDAVFFNEKIRLTQDPNRPVPRLNAALFDASANAKPNTEEVLLNEGALVRQAEFRIFTNYSPFISSWRLDIMDADTRKVIRSIEGTALNINDPIYWNGRDDQDIIINPDHKYSYVFSVADNKNNRDDTKEKPITVREIKDDADLKKERDETKDVLKDRAVRYRKWLDAEAAVNNLDHQVIQVNGETIHLDRQGTDVKSIHVMKGNDVFLDIPLSEQYGLTPDELMAGGFSTTDEKDNLEVILPNGDYTLDVVSVKAPGDPDAQDALAAVPPLAPAAVGGMPSRTKAPAAPGPLEHYSRPLKVGDDYIMFVALGDAQVGYNIDRGNIEPIQDDTQEPGFYHEGKGAYYLKGQILGKYLVTSSYDSDRAEKALFRSLDPNVYYPVYGDSSTVNYDAADTQGALYLKVEWDKSTAILGNYAIDFNDTEFAAFSRAYYGGKIDYKSVSSNPYGDARTKIVVYHAQVQQLPSHNEFLATGGSLYFLKYRNVVQGSDTVTIQVRDQTSGLVVASQTMTNGADYELDNSNGSILFWQPVAMIAQSENIISNNLINGDPIYVVVDYQYAVSGMQTQGSQGARVAQGIGDNVVLGGTYVQDNSSGQEYSLEGTDATLHLDKDSTIKAEYAKTKSQEQGSYVSTDGGITFTSLGVTDSASGSAYGITGDGRLFDNIGLKSYYKWIGSDFGASGSTSEQGTIKTGLSMTFDLSPVTRLTASEDIQKLLAGGNLQTSTQVGASETDTTMVQIVHTAERLKLTGQFQLVETKSVINGVESTTNQRGATMGGQAQYDLTDRIKVTLGQQVDVVNKDNTATTVAIADRISDHTTLNAQDVFSSQGSAITAGMTNKITPKIALTTDYTLTSLNTGVVDKTASVGIADQVSKNITTTGTVATTQSSTGTTTTTASIGTIAKISDSATVNMSVGKSQNATGAQGATNVSLNGTTQIGNTTLTGTATATGGAGAGASSVANSPLATDSTGLLPGSNPLSIGTTGVSATSSVGVQAVTKVDENTSTNGSINVANDSTGGKTTTFGFGDTSKLTQELQAVTDTSFSLSPGTGTSDSTKYGLVRTNPSGQKVEADFTQASANQPGTVSESNIYGLTGDVNDNVAVTANIQRGKVQNLGTSQSTITDFSLGSGYVLKDTESAEATLKNSAKLELRLDRGVGTDSLRQYVLYDALEGKFNDNTTGNIKVDYSKTLDTTTGAVAERHQEIILGMAYRPVNFDKLNLITEYSYQDGFGGGTQQADALNTNVQTTIAQVLSAEAVYDINENWQADEKLAYRIENEQDTGFQFTETHTWLVIHRLNYKIDKDWTLSAEYRDLAQVEAKDNKMGLLLQATRDLNANTQLAFGWNFTKYSDDLTDLSYTSLGPFVRMTGKFYDETPEERARARAKWLDAKISDWAWVMIAKEFSKKDSKIVLELNRMFALAKASQKAGRLEESQQIYKDIIAAGQIMFDEACEYIRRRIAFEQQMQQLTKTAQDYYKGGEYVKARKIWEKVVDEASKGVVK